MDNNAAIFEATECAVHAEDGVVIIAFSAAESGRPLEVSMPVEAARLLYSQLTIALNAHQHMIPTE